MRKLPFKEKSILFAPMESVTDEAYRVAVDRAFPNWDYHCTDFLRVPTVGGFSTSKIIDHLGTKVIEDKRLRAKTGFQILTSYRAQTEAMVKQINQIEEISHLDLNLGCPSRKVNAHKGGAYLLSEMKELREIIQIVRKNFSKSFTVKIRTGYRDTSKFLDSLKLFEDEGVDAIIVHARTRDQLYKGVADWKYIEQAVKTVNIPVIGNGDIWTLSDIEKIFNECGCDSVMLGRGALKTPWLTSLYSQYKDSINKVDDELLLEERRKNLKIYFSELESEFRLAGADDVRILKRFKSFSRYLFEDFEDGDAFKSKILRTGSIDLFKEMIQSL